MSIRLYSCDVCGKKYRYYRRSHNGIKHSLDEVLLHHIKMTHPNYHWYGLAHYDEESDAYDNGYIGDGDYAY